MPPVSTPKTLRESRKVGSAHTLRSTREASANATTGASLSRAEVAAQVGVSESLWAQYEDDDSKDAKLLACDVAALPMGMRMALIAALSSALTLAAWVVVTASRIGGE